MQPIKEERNFDWSTLGHFGLVWAILGHFGVLWSALYHSGLWLFGPLMLLLTFFSFRFVDTMQLRRLARMHHEVFPQWGGRHPGDIFLHQAFHLF